MQRTKDFVYCCGGISRNNIMSSCERYSLTDRVWTSDVPELTEGKFSMTLMVQDKTWLYGFGGFTVDNRHKTGYFEVERLNTDFEILMDTKWEIIKVETTYEICC